MIFFGNRILYRFHQIEIEHNFGSVTIFFFLSSQRSNSSTSIDKVNFNVVLRSNLSLRLML